MQCPLDVSFWVLCATMIKGPYSFLGVLKRPPICYLLWSDEVQEECIITERCSKVKGDGKWNSYQEQQQGNVLILREIVISLFLLSCVGFLMGLYCVCMYLLDEMSAFCVHGANWKFHHMPSFFFKARYLCWICDEFSFILCISYRAAVIAIIFQACKCPVSLCQHIWEHQVWELLKTNAVSNYLTFTWLLTDVDGKLLFVQG